MPFATDPYDGFDGGLLVPITTPDGRVVRVPHTIADRFLEVTPGAKVGTPATYRPNANSGPVPIPGVVIPLPSDAPPIARNQKPGLLTLTRDAASAPEFVSPMPNRFGMSVDGVPIGGVSAPAAAPAPLPPLVSLSPAQAEAFRAWVASREPKGAR